MGWLTYDIISFHDHMVKILLLSNPTLSPGLCPNKLTLILINLKLVCTNLLTNWTDLVKTNKAYIKVLIFRLQELFCRKMSRLAWTQVSTDSGNAYITISFCNLDLCYLIVMQVEKCSMYEHDPGQCLWPGHQVRWTDLLCNLDIPM